MFSGKKKYKYIALCMAMMLGLTACKSNNVKDDKVTESPSDIVEINQDSVDNKNVFSLTEMSPKEIVEQMTLEQKASQMLMPAVYNLQEGDMKKRCYGSILSKSEALTFDEWQKVVDGFQREALESEAGIPYIYGQDDVHGVNYCDGAVMFPQNIGMGAANDEDLMYQVGLATADEAKLCHMIWNYAPVVAQSADPRWGRTYESYGADLDIIKKLSKSYTKGLLDGGMIVCPKHFFGDGNVIFGTGEDPDTMLIDRGDAQLSDEEIDQLLSVYQELIDIGVQTIMISHSSLNGVKMHENAKYIQYLKNEMGFDGFVASDWDSVQHTSGATYKDQIITSVNAGIDLFMEVDRYDEAIDIIISAVEDGSISQERINDAVERILKVKKEAGIFDDPFYENITTIQSATGSDEYRALAQRAVEESLVLLKNENNVLPLKESTKVFITGPAADNASVQCGGWSIDWNSSPSEEITGATTILQGFKDIAEEMDIEIITDYKKAKEADMVIAVLGEEPYAEWNGDTADMDLCGSLGLGLNETAIDRVKILNKPSVACIVAGRQVLITDYMDTFDSIVMCYLPGTEGQGVANVLTGKADFKGKLPSPWYSSVDDILTEKCLFEKGYGLTYQ